MTKWTLRKPAMLLEIPEGGYAPRSGIALLVSMVVYLTYLGISLVPALVHAGIFFSQHAVSMDNLMDTVGAYMADQGTLLVSLFLSGALIGTTIFYIKRIEKRPLSTIGIRRGRIARRYLAGFGIGAALIALTMGPALFLDDVTYNGVNPVVALFLIAFVIQGASEEVFFRGFLLTSTARKIGVFWAVVMTSAFFSILHIVTITSLMDVIVLFLVGALLAVVTVRTGSLWAACGLHTAWNFLTGLLTSANAGGLKMDYSVVTIGDPNAPLPDHGFWGDPYMAVYAALFAAAIAVVVFAGKNRLVIPRPEAELTLMRAKKTAKRLLPGAYYAYAAFIAQMVRGDDEKSAALLCLVCEQGVTPEALADMGIGETARTAAQLLARRGGESEETRWARVCANPAAQAVWHAQTRYAAELAARQAAANWQAHTDRYAQAMGAYMAGRDGTPPNGQNG